MRAFTSQRCLAIALLAGALACARNPETDTATVRDTTVTDTTGAAENPPGYRGMERDTTQVPPTERTGVDSVMLKEGTGQQDTVPTDTIPAGQMDTAGFQQPSDTAANQGQVGQDSVRLPHDSLRIQVDSPAVNAPERETQPADTGAAPSQ